MQAFRSSPLALVTDTDAIKPIAGDATGLARWLTRHHHRAMRCQMTSGTQVFSEDDEVDHLYVLARGWALKYKSLFDGRRQVLDFALPGDVLGFVGERRARHAVEMLTDGEVVSIPRELFGSFATAHPELTLNLARQFERAATRAHEHMVSIGCRSAMSRVSRLLMELAERHVTAGDLRRNIEIATPIRQLHIADALGLRGETVCRVLKRLAKANIATFRHGLLHIPLLDDLQRVAESPEAEKPLARATPYRAATAPREPTPAAA